MTAREFSMACQRRTVHEGVAMENEKIVAALKARDDEEVLRVLDEEF